MAGKINDNETIDNKVAIIIDCSSVSSVDTRYLCREGNQVYGPVKLKEGFMKGATSLEEYNAFKGIKFEVYVTPLDDQTENALRRIDELIHSPLHADVGTLILGLPRHVSREDIVSSAAEYNKRTLFFDSKNDSRYLVDMTIFPLNK